MPSFQSPLRYLRENRVFHVIYYLCLIAIITGFIYSRALLSIGQIAMAANWLLEGDLKRKVSELRSNGIALLLTGFYFLHLIWLLNTSEDFSYAGEDLRIKLPLLLCPIVFSTAGILSPELLRKVALFFTAVITSATIVITYSHIASDNNPEDIREASFLISHIRLALMICLSIAFSIYYALRGSTTQTVLLMAVSAWLVVFMIWFVYLTGIFILSMLCFLAMLFVLTRRKTSGTTKGIVIAALAGMFAPVGYITWKAVSDYTNAGNHPPLEDLKETAGNREYDQWHLREGYNLKENGYFVFQNVNFEETEREWNRRSKQPISYHDGILNRTEDVLLRYLASKGLAKDSASVSSLGDDEVQAIEGGISNVITTGRSGLYRRIFNLCWEYDVYRSGGNINGLSFATRLEYWRTGTKIFMNNWLFGTGTGDIEEAFQDQYKADKSRLLPEMRYRTHNQFISVAATFGIIGFMYFLSMIFLPLWNKRRDALYFCFSLIFILSIITEDTLETQIGVSFYAFFNSLIFFTRGEEI